MNTSEGSEFRNRLERTSYLRTQRTRWKSAVGRWYLMRTHSSSNTPEKSSNRNTPHKLVRQSDRLRQHRDSNVPQVFEDVACTVCGCVCDDLRITVDDGEVTKGDGAYYLAEPWFLEQGLKQPQDYLQPFYGHPDWGLRTVFNSYLDWFAGNATSRSPLPPRAESERMVTLAGGMDQQLQVARDALADDDAQWAAQLADHLLAFDSGDHAAKQVEAEALSKLAHNIVNATVRNYNLTVARKLREPAKQE